MCDLVSRVVCQSLEVTLVGRCVGLVLVENRNTAVSKGVRWAVGSTLSEREPRRKLVCWFKAMRAWDGEPQNTTTSTNEKELEKEAASALECDPPMESICLCRCYGFYDRNVKATSR